MSPYKVLVVDDSVFMRKLVSDLIAEDPAFRVVDTARNGKEAVEKTRLLQPDVITMDIEMPEMNGLEALRQIMDETPKPVVMLSSLTDEGTKETIQALEWGAVDFIRKPSGSISLDIYKVKEELLEKLKIAVKTKINRTVLKTQLVAPQPSVPVQSFDPSANRLRFSQLVAIGTSTGGPKALHQVISQIPPNFPAPIVIVQHMPPNFTKSLSQRLDQVSSIHVVEAEDGMVLQSAVAYVAPGGWHMTVMKESSVHKIRLNKQEPRGGHRPSVDMLFESLLPFTDLKKHVVLMTGMGSDGAKGMQSLRKSGAVTTIAESEETCVVYGMPRAAVELDCVTDVVPLYQISNKLAQVVLEHEQLS